MSSVSNFPDTATPSRRFTGWQLAFFILLAVVISVGVTGVEIIEVQDGELHISLKD